MVHNYLQLIGISTLTLLMYMSFWFVVSLARKRNDVADIAWGLGFAVIAIVGLSLNTKVTFVGLLVTVLTGIWGLRLAGHILLRNRGKTEDFRYAKWRKDWGKWFLVRSYVQVFLFQGLLLMLVVQPVLVTAGLAHKIDVSAWAAAGVLTWSLGFYFEAVGDLQLTKFVSDPKNKGKIMDQGLWQYTRHPNYFGEVTQWWGLWLVTCSTDLTLGIKAISLVGPVAITILILFVSGVPLLEKKYSSNPAYAKYSKKTARFFPVLHAFNLIQLLT